MGTTYHGSDWLAAHDFIQRGRSKEQRKFSKTRELRYIGEPDADGHRAIALRLHNTDVVTYHLDDTQTLYMGGWNTRLTKDCLNAHSSARVYGLSQRNKRIYNDDYSVAVYHSSDPISAPRVQRCRSCKATGIVRQWCRGRGSSWRYPTWLDEVWAALPGHTWHEHHDATDDEINPKYSWQKAVEPGTIITRTFTRSRRNADNAMEPCWHGMIEAHTWQEECSRCGGSGQVDFGSNPVPYGFSSSDEVHVDVGGRVIHPELDDAALRRALLTLRRRMRRPAA